MGQLLLNSNWDIQIGMSPSSQFTYNFVCDDIFYNLGHLWPQFVDYSRENSQKGKYHCMPDLLFDWFGFDQTSKTVLKSTSGKQQNPNKINSDISP